MNTFDLASLDALKTNQEDGAELKIKHPISGEPVGLTLRIAGYDSDAVKKVQRRQTNERLRNQRKKLTAEEIERSGREVVTAAVLGWSFEGLTIDGAVPEFSKDAVEGLIRRFPFIAGQIDEFASDQANFLQS